MGYDTDFTGQVTLTPPLSPEQVSVLKAFAGARHDIFDHAAWCDWEPTADGKAIAWNEHEKTYKEHEKTYAAQLWLEHLLRTFLEPQGHIVNGVIEAEGEEPDDLWRIEVRDNAVHPVRLLVLPDNEEIDPSDPGDWSDQLRARFDAGTRRNHVFAVRDGRLHEVGPADETGFAPIRERA